MRITRHRFLLKYLWLSWGSLRCFVSLCIVVLLGLFASFLDRVIHLSYISNSSSIRKVQQRSKLSDVEYPTYRLFNRALVRETIHKSQQDIWKTQQLKQLVRTTATLQLINVSHNGEFETRHQRLEQSGEHNKSKKLLDQGRNLQIFKKDWCQMQRARLDWKAILSPCLNQTAWEEPNSHGIDQITDSSKCYITHWDIKQTGEFSRFFIQTVTTSNVTKTLGGDSWRIHLHGPSSLAPTVFDLGNGTYEILFLIIEAGSYDAKIFLDYSLCHGLKDPPREWFKKGNYQGKNQPDGTLKGDRPYLISPFRDGEQVRFFVPPSNNSQQQVDALEAEVLSAGVHSHTCDSTCSSFLWDGFGRWVNGQWKPYIKGDVTKDKRRREGTFISFGDSLSNRFLLSLSTGPYRDLCDSVFTSCRPVYHWVYHRRGSKSNGVKSPREPLPDNVDYQHEHVLSDIKKTLFNPELSNKSVLLMNLGMHFVATVNFTNYKRLINDVIITVNAARDESLALTSNYFKGRLIWKTTTALNRQRFPNPHKDVRRFLTFPRVELYNAYATSAMCRAGVDVIDVYPISNSYPGGTISSTDHVHYGDQVFREVESLLHQMFHSTD